MMYVACFSGVGIPRCAVRGTGVNLSTRQKCTVCRTRRWSTMTTKDLYCGFVQRGGSLARMGRRGARSSSGTRQPSGNETVCAARQSNQHPALL
eukprot:3839750-Prymnesium_polylepis.1